MDKSYIRSSLLFPPFPIQPDVHGFEQWRKISNKNWLYVPNGRAAIFHIVRALGVHKILISSYLCASVLEGLRAAEVEVHFMDVEPDQLMPSVEQLKRRLSIEKFDAVLWASLYGQAGSLIEVEQICRSFKTYLIDDAAQSFGALDADRRVGEFGAAGLISFAPGKATAGPLGAFFWVDKDYSFATKRHAPFHWLKTVDFYWNRYEQKKWPLIPWILSKLSSFLTRKNFYYFDKYESYEWPVLGGIVGRELNLSTAQLRRERFRALEAALNKFSDFEVYKTNFKNSNPHKLVVIFSKELQATHFKEALLRAGIRTGHGYTSLEKSCLNASALWGRVVELPIFYDSDRANDLLKVVENYKNSLSFSN